MKKTWRVWKEGKGLLDIHFNDEQGYYSITTDCGAAHDTILKLAPELEPLVRLHLKPIDIERALIEKISFSAYALGLYLAGKKLSGDKDPLEAVRKVLWWESGMKDQHVFSDEFELLLKMAKYLYKSYKGWAALIKDMGNSESQIRIYNSSLEMIVAGFVLLYRDHYEQQFLDASRLAKEYNPPLDIPKLDPRENELVRFSNGLEVSIIDSHDMDGEFVYEISVGPEMRYTIAESSEKAGEAAKSYWKWLAENDHAEFVELVGSDTLSKWAVGLPAGPGSTKVTSFEEWLDLWLDIPEEHWAGWDGKETVLEISAKLAEKFSIPNPGDKDWVEVVAYRQ